MNPGSQPIRILATTLRISAKALLWLFAVCLTIVLLWFAANRLLDESPDPDRDAFFARAVDRIPNEQNAAVGILGLTAPAGTGFVEYGATVKALYRSGAPWPQIRDRLQGPGTMKLTVTSDQVTCWLDPDFPAFAHFKGCLPFAKAAGVLKDNSKVLDRYRSLYRMEGYSGLDTLQNQAFLVLVKLSVAEMQLAIRSRHYERAYRAWRDQLSFVKRNLRGPDSWVGKAVEIVAFGMTFDVIENLLRADPQIATRHRDELLDLLRPEGMQAFDPDGIVRAEYSLFRRALQYPPEKSDSWPLDRLHWLAFHFGQRNRILNRYYVFARDYAQMLHLPWSQVASEAARLRDKHVLPSDWDIVLDPFGSLFLARDIESQLKSRELLRQLHIVDGKFRLGSLLVRVVDEHVSDKDIPKFLSSAGPAYFDPFSRGPMKWNARERRLYLPDPEYKCAMYASLQVPAPTHDSGTAPPSAQSEHC